MLQDDPGLPPLLTPEQEYAFPYTLRNSNHLQPDGELVPGECGGSRSARKLGGADRLHRPASAESHLWRTLKLRSIPRVGQAGRRDVLGELILCTDRGVRLHDSRGAWGVQAHGPRAVRASVDTFR